MHPADVPDAPPFKPLATTVDDTSVTVSWEPAPANGAAVTHYSIDCEPVPLGGQPLEFSECTEKQVAGLTRGVSYTFQVRAKNAAGPSAADLILRAPVVPSTHVRAVPYAPSCVE